MKVNLSLSQKGLLVVGITLILEMIFVGVLLQSWSDANAELDREQQAQTIIYHLNRQANLMQRLTIEFIRFVVTKKAETTPQQRRLQSELDAEFATLKALLSEDPTKKAAIDDLQATLASGTALMDRCRQAWFDGDQTLHYMLAAKMHTVSDLCSDKSDRILDGFLKLEESSHAKREQLRTTLSRLLLIGLVLNIAICIALALSLTRGITKRLETIADNSLRLSMGKQLNPLLGGNDELARVDKTFHNMAKALETMRRQESAILENAKDVICSLDAEERFTKVSAAALSNWGYAPEDLIGSRLVSLIAAEDKEHTLEAIQRIMKDESQAAIENRIIKKDGSILFVEWSVQWAPEEKSLFCVAHDVTERKNIENQKQEFVAMVSHDLRTPLTAIRGTLQLVEENVLDPRSDAGRKRLRGAQESAERLIDLVNDLLDIEKLEAGNMQLDLQCIDLNYVIEKSVESVHSAAEKQGVAVKSQATDLQVIADRDRLIQVLVNLLSNAIKYSLPESLVEISVQAKGSMAEVKVTDHGCGIPKQFHESIFERFKQVSKSDDKRGKGTGLGLAISKAIIESHSGRIGVESEEGKGSTFWLMVPLA
jgi:PAS domain S-box-containing protein